MTDFIWHHGTFLDDRLYLASRNFLIGPSLSPQQTASVLHASRPDPPIADSSTQSTQSSSSVSSPSIASRVRWPSERRQSFRNTPSGRNDTYRQILRFHHACAPKLAGRCCWSYRCKPSRTGSRRCRRNSCVRSSSSTSQTCHPERSECFAKRSNHGVEGPHARVQRQWRCKAFSPLLCTGRRENALQRLCRSRQCRGPSTPCVSRFARDRFRSG